MMLIIRKDPVTGVLNRLYLDITDDQYKYWLSGVPAHVAFPRLNDDQIEFLLSGIPPGKWREYVGNENYEVVE